MVHGSNPGYGKNATKVSVSAAHPKTYSKDWHTYTNNKNNTKKSQN